MTMTRRLYVFLRYYLTAVAVFVLGKLFFCCINATGGVIGLSDVPAVIWHGLPLDFCMAGYIAIIPLLFFSLMRRGTVIMMVYNVIVALLISVAVIVDAFLYGFWGFKLDATVLNYIDQPGQAFASVSLWYVVWRCLAIMLTAVLIYLALPHKAVDAKRNPWMLLLAAPLFVIIRGGVSESTANVGMVYFSDKTFLNHAAVNPMFSFMSSISKTEKFSEQFNFFSEDECGRLFNGLYAVKNDSAVTQQNILNTTRPNVLIVIMEGFGYNVMEAAVGNKQVAPNIKAIAADGLLFSQCFANSFRTDRGVVSILSGFPGQPTTSVMKMANRCGNLPSIAKSMRQAGYATDFVYGGDINFTNMRGYLLSTGYERLVAMGDFSLSEQHSNAWGAQDEYTAKRVAMEIKGKKASPWLLTYLTLSSHEPFEVPRQIIENDEVLNSFAYTDQCVGELVSELRKTTSWKNLLVVLLPDHGIRGVKALGSIGQYSPEYYHIPLIITGGALRDDMRGIRINKIMNQTDVPATLLAQMEIGHSQFEFSRNVLHGNYKYPFAFSTFSNGFVFRDSTGVTIYDNNAGKVTTDTPLPSAQRLKRGRAILQTLYDRLEQLGTINSSNTISPIND